MLEARLRELDLETARRPDDPGSWIALSALASRSRRRLPREAPRRLGLARLLRFLRELPEERGLARYLPALLGVKVLAGKSEEPGRFWHRGDRLGEAPDHWYDRVTGLPLHYQRPRDGSRMVLVPEGPALFGDGHDRREVEVDTFLIDLVPVTRERYADFLRSEWRIDEAETYERNARARELDAGTPATHVSWENARRYALWAGVDLPTGDQWEKAARGVRGATYPWGEASPTPRLANFDPYLIPAPSRSIPRRRRTISRMGECLQSVGRYLAGRSPYGLLDCAGSVWEWSADLSFRVDNPEELDGEGSLIFVQQRIVMGGGWLSDPDSLHCSKVCYAPIEPRDYVDVGFRCAHWLDWNRRSEVTPL